MTAELIRLSGGNPFALEELARAVVESGWIDVATGAPPERRLRHGPLDPRRVDSRPLQQARSGRSGDVIRWAAVIGEQFDVRLVAAAADIGEDEALSALAQLCRGRAWSSRMRPIRPATASRSGTPSCTRRWSRSGWSPSAPGATRPCLRAAERLVAEGHGLSAAEMARHAVAAGDRRRIVVLSRAAAADGPTRSAPSRRRLRTSSWRSRAGTPRTASSSAPSSCSSAGGCGHGSRGATSARWNSWSGPARPPSRWATAATAAVALALLADARFEFGQREQALARLGARP